MSRSVLSGLVGLLLAACASDRPPLLEDDPRARGGQTRVDRARVDQTRAVMPPPVAAPPVILPEEPTAVPAARAPFRAPLTQQDEASSAAPYTPRAPQIAPQIADAPDPAAGLDQDPYFAGALERARQGSDEPRRADAPPRVGADAGADVSGAPFALRGDAAPEVPDMPDVPAARPLTAPPALPETARAAPRLARDLPGVVTEPLSAPPPRATASDLPSEPLPRAFLADPQGALDAVNAYRRRYGYAPLSYDPVLSQVALDHARDLAARGEVASVTAAGEGVIDRLALRGYRANAAASLVAGGYDAFGDAMTSWRRDRIQRSRLLLPQATEIGIARVEDPRSPYRYYIELIVATE